MRERYGANDTTFFTAMTGSAAYQLGPDASGKMATTFHAWLGVGVESLTDRNTIQEVIKPWVRKRHNVTKRVFVDEISFIDGTFFEYADRALQITRKNSRPFGGIQIILLGDFLQLKSRSTFYAFATASWRRLIGDRVIVLQQVFRQNDPVMIRYLAEIRVGEVSDEADTFIKENLVKAPPVPVVGVPPPVSLYPSRDEVKLHNETELKKLPGEPVVFTARDGCELKSESYLTRLINDCGASSPLTLKVGAPVMLLVNTNTDKGLTNGAVGIATKFIKSRIADEGIVPVVTIRGTLQKFGYHQFSLTNKARVVAWRYQIPLSLAWALTIHKCQGLTLWEMILDTRRIREEHQIYSALSRMRDWSRTYLTYWNRSLVKVDRKVLEFYAKYDPTMARFAAAKPPPRPLMSAAAAAELEANPLLGIEDEFA